MANGKGSIMCGYCVHMTTAGHCGFHEATLPVSPKNWNTFCANFEPGDAYWRDQGNPEFMPLVRRFARFGAELKPGVLYHFHYNEPKSVEPIATLRVPDYHTNEWRPA